MYVLFFFSSYCSKKKVLSAQLKWKKQKMISHIRTYTHTYTTTRHWYENFFLLLVSLDYFFSSSQSCNRFVNPFVQSLNYVVNGIKRCFITNFNKNYVVLYFFMWEMKKKLGHCIIFIYYFFFWHTQTDDEPCTRHIIQSLLCKNTLIFVCMVCVSRREICQIFFYFLETTHATWGQIDFHMENENHNKRNTISFLLW